MPSEKTYDVAIIGAGFAGLAAALELTAAGKSVAVFERDDQVGGLAGSFMVGGEKLEKFYHHWFTNDEHVMDLIKELGQEDKILMRPTRTGMYYANNFFRLSTPKDLLRFTPLGFFDRVRLGLLALKARKVENWQELEELTASEWLKSMGGEKVFKVVWEPLLTGKFGPFAEDVSAVWFWNKLKLRGGSRGKGGAENLAYYKGGFASLAESMATRIKARGGEVFLETPVEAILTSDGRASGVRTLSGDVLARSVVATTALPVFADLVEPLAPAEYVSSLRKVQYLANICLVLELDRSLSSTYWLNVNEPDFPYVGVIEHTNFEPPTTYGGRHIVYLSKYLPEDAELFRMSDDEVFEFSLPHIKKMFPEFDRRWVLGRHVWRALYSQPIVVKNYSRLIPAEETPVEGLFLSTMAQVYPEDRGTNYAIRHGRAIGKKVAAGLQ